MPDEGVSRSKRRGFTYAVVGGSTVIALFLALRGVDTRVAQIVAEGLMTMALATTCTYIGASAIDYSIGDRGAFRSTRGVSGSMTTERTTERTSSIVPATTILPTNPSVSSRAD